MFLKQCFSNCGIQPISGVKKSQLSGSPASISQKMKQKTVEQNNTEQSRKYQSTSHRAKIPRFCFTKMLLLVIYFKIYICLCVYSSLQYKILGGGWLHTPDPFENLRTSSKYSPPKKGEKEGGRKEGREGGRRMLGTYTSYFAWVRGPWGLLLGTVPIGSNTLVTVDAWYYWTMPTAFSWCSVNDSQCLQDAPVRYVAPPCWFFSPYV